MQSTELKMNIYWSTLRVPKDGIKYISEIKYKLFQKLLEWAGPSRLVDVFANENYHKMRMQKDRSIIMEQS